MFQQLFLAYMFSVVHGTILINDFENIILPPNSTLNIRYLDHFEGTKLQYNFEIVTEDGKQAMEFHIPEENLFHQKSLSKWPPSSIFREMSTYSDNSSFYSFYFSEHKVGCLEFNFMSQILDQKWIESVDSSKKNFTISGVSIINFYNPYLQDLYKKKPLQKKENEYKNPYFQSQILNFTIEPKTLPTLINFTNNHLLLVLGSEYSNPTKTLTNVFYIANIINCDKHQKFSKKHIKFMQISLPQVSNVTQLYLSRYFTTEIVSLSGCDNGSAYVYIYNFSNAFKPKFIQRIYENVCLKPLTNYSSFPLESVVLQMRNLSYQLIVLDRAYGLESYILTDGIFTVGFDIDMSLYGNLLGFYQYLDPSNIENLAFVRTIHGVFVVQTKDMTEVNYVVSIDSAGNKSIASGVFSYDGFAYLIFIENDSRVSIGIVNLKYPRSTLNYTIIDDEDVNINGQWEFIRGSKHLFYIRVDNGQIRHLNCDPKNPILKLTTKDTNLTYNVKATDIYGDSKMSTFKVFLTTPNLYDVILTDNGRPYAKPPTVIIDFLISDGIVEIPTYMFSGWNLTCGLEDYYDSNNNITVVDNTPEKINFYKSFNFNQGAKVMYVEGYIVVIEEKNITLINFEDDSFMVYKIPGVVQVKSLVLGNDQAFYAISKTLLFKCKLFLIYKKSITHIESFFRLCNQLVVNQDYLVISGIHIVSIYIIKSISSPEFLISIALRSKKLKFPIIKELSISTLSNSDTLLYIGTYSNIGVINLNTLKNKYLTIDDPKKLFFILNDYFASGSNYAYVSNYGELIQYDNYFKTPLLKLDINATGLVELDGYVLAFNNTSVFLIDSNEEYIKNSVIFSNQIYGTNISLFYGSSGNGYIGLVNNQTIEIYSIYCPVKGRKCDDNVRLNVSMEINDSTANNALSLPITIRCWNDFSSFSTTINALILTYGMSITKSIYLEKLQSENITVEYGTEETIKFSDLFSGYDLQAELILNNQSVSENDNLPAYINPSLKQSANYHINDVSVTYDVIIDMNFTLVLTEANNVLLVNTLTGNIDGNFSILSDFNVTLICMRIESISTIWPYSLFIVGCNYMTIIKQVGLKYTEGSIIISLIIDLGNQTCISKSETEIDAVPSFTKVIQGTERTFSLLILDGLVGTDYDNNNIWVYKGIWDEFKVSITFDQAVNYYTLSLDQFCAISLDGTYDFNDTLTLYVLDYSYGLRALRSYSGMIMEIIDGLYFDYSVLAIGLCGRTLFVGFEDTSIMVLMLIQGKMQYYMTYFPYNNASSLYTTLRGFISCSNYYSTNYYSSSYITLPMKNQTMIVVRVINLFSDYASSVVRDIIVTYDPNTILGFSKVGFLNSSSFITLDIQLNELNVFSLQSFSLVFPALPISQYEDMKKQWGKSLFEMVLHVYNGRSSITTDVIILNRVDDDDDTNKRNETKVSLWIVIMIVFCVLFILVVTVISVYRIVMKRRMRKEQERQKSFDDLIVNVQNGKFY